MTATSQLPVDAVLPCLARALAAHPAAVLKAPTGSGKTTRVAPFLLNSGLLSPGRILLLQPRRVAARACARILAEGMGQTLGKTVGYHIRFDKKAGPETRILVITEGILTRLFLEDPLLEGVSCVILDEFHERSIHTDLALAFLTELLTLRRDLKLVVMSATLNGNAIKRYLSDCPLIEAEGRVFPIEIRYREKSPKQNLGNAVAGALRVLFEEPGDDGGHVLVFLPGAPEIRRVMRDLEGFGPHAERVPLHGGLSAAEQDRALAKGGSRKIILATNIAETSLTIEGVSAVIDSGFHKLMVHDPVKGIDRLDLKRISRASAAQRAGRAGRTRPGRVIRLWSENLQAALQPWDLPEIQRIDLANALLQILQFNGPDLASFPFFEAPPGEALERAHKTLRQLGCLDDRGRLNQLGTQLARLPIHPRLGGLLAFASTLGQIPIGAMLCAILSERSPDAHGSLDLMEQLERLQRLKFRGQPPSNRLEFQSTQRILKVSQQLEKMARRWWRSPGKGSLKQRDIARMLLSGFPDRLCKVRGEGLGTMVGGRGITFDGARFKFDAGFFLALELVESGRIAALARQVFPVEIDDIKDRLSLRRLTEAVFENKRSTVSGVSRLYFGDLIIEERASAQVSQQDLAQVLAEHAQDQFEEIFRPDGPTLAFIFRLRFAARHLPEENWPDAGREGLRNRLPELCFGLKSFAELRKINWLGVLSQELSFRLKILLDKEVPEKIRVPSGSQIRIDYGAAFQAGELPVLAVRLQEVFGMKDTPRVSRGRVPLLCHLLAPNMRPAQITRDLRSFWNNTYREVRKDLRRRYPKHAWPEDPWAAEAIRGTRKRRPR